MNDNINETEFLNVRLFMLLLLHVLLFIALLSRAFQLQILSAPLIKVYNKQHDNILKTKELMKDLQYSLDELTVEQKKHFPETIFLAAEKAKLLREINELKPKYDKLSNDVSLLNKSLSDLSIIEEKRMQNVINIYDRIYRREKWSNFILSFLMGVITSVVGSIIYNSVATKHNMPLIGNIIEALKKIYFTRRRSKE